LFLIRDCKGTGGRTPEASGGFRTDFLTVFNKGLQGNWRPEAPETILRIHGVGLNLIVFNKELQGNWRPETPEASGVISLLLFMRHSEETGGRRLRRLPEWFPYCFQYGIARKKEASHSGGFRSNFPIVFNKEFSGNWRPDSPEASGVISLLF
jgi:hypothetical protein